MFFHLSTAVEVFGRVVLPTGEPKYRVLVCATEPVVSAGPTRMATDYGIEAAAEADTIIVPGNDVIVDTSDDVLDTLRFRDRLGGNRFCLQRRHPHRVYLLERLHAGGRRLARRTTRDDALGYVDPLMLRGGLGVVDAMPSARILRRQGKDVRRCDGSRRFDTDVADIPGAGSQPRVTVVGEVPPPFRDTQAIEVHAMAERVATPSEAQLEARFETNTYAHAVQR